jgi:hypothetical protein
LLTAGLAGGEEVQVGRLTVYSCEEVGRFCFREGSSRYIEFPGTQRWALLEGESLYRPMPVGEVAEALGQISFPLQTLDGDIVILPVPRRDMVESTAEGTVVFLSPGRVDYPREHIHYTVTHEMGHVLHHVLMPDSREDLWKEYARLRGIDWQRAREAQDHASRLHEIFAEDFRVLFGSDLARCGTGVENHDISPPGEVPGLREFFLSLLDQWQGKVRIYASPNPFRGQVLIKGICVGDDVHLDDVTIFDTQGRVIHTIRASALGRGEIIWDAKNSSGLTVAPGVYFMAIRIGRDLQMRKITKIPG